MSTKAPSLEIKKAAMSPFCDDVLGSEATSSSIVKRHSTLSAARKASNSQYRMQPRYAHVPDGDDVCRELNTNQQTSSQLGRR
ncbi:uncharacterized protein ARMOST_14365 [Armillaria ostoyae]|uniref:Uncharacterized protein n=1 Tax=Armillaria ostoyae TaxID=47428 RepID=A0A284RQC0_ARMOS|nr:uncharacterized protein ARMOST_14365 [Armillaria ostoyae]